MLTGLVYCGSACSGGADTNAGAWGERSEPWRFYVCGNQKRKGWATCELGKVSVDKVERAIIHHALDQVLTRDYLFVYLYLPVIKKVSRYGPETRCLTDTRFLFPLVCGEILA